MDEQIRRMTPTEAEAYRAKFRKDTAKAGPGRFQHFTSEAAKQAHLQQVAQSQQHNEVPF